MMAAWIACAAAWVAALASLYAGRSASRSAREARASMWQVATLTKLVTHEPAREYSIGPLIVIPDDDPVYRQLDEDEAAHRDH